MNLTLDGFLSGPDCELDWHFDLWTTDMAKALCSYLEKADTLLFGRITYVAMAKYWTSRGMDITCPDEDKAFVQMMNSYKKIVFSNTLTKPLWNNTTLISSSLKEEVAHLKMQEGGDIIVYGSSQLVKSLMELDVIDEYHLWVHPLTIGNGKSLFKNNTIQMQLQSSQSFCSGVVLLNYKNNKARKKQP